MAKTEGDLPAAQAAAERQLARRIGPPLRQANALMQLGTVAYLRDDLAGAGACWREAPATVTNRQWTLRYQGYLALVAGRPAETSARLDEALAVS